MAAAVIAFAIVVFAWFLRDEPEPPGAHADVPSATRSTASPTSAAVPIEKTALRIASGGRLSVASAELPRAGLALEIDMPDEARGHGDRAVRVISGDGRRIDTTASPLPGSGTGSRLVIDSDWLARGRYMIEVETEDKHPLQIRRYVLEVQ
jgi:hypothetical protein